jgi:transposase InsO family protein
MNDIKLGPRDHAEAVALFRAEIIGALARQELSRGELRARLRALSKQRFRSPGSRYTRCFAVSTLERWYYRYKEGGLAALRSNGRNDRGRARALDHEIHRLLCDIRREFPSASATLILRTLVTEGVLQKDQLTPVTLRRFYQQHGLPRGQREKGGESVRLRWQAERPHALWHGDVCHGPTLHVAGEHVPLRIHGLLDDRSRASVALEPLSSEREQDMLEIFVRALLIHGKPDALYLDNGATYRGDALRLACERLGITLIHAQPHDPQARGKMERFWRTLREQCLDFIGTTSSLHDVRVRLLAWLEEYHRTPHAGLMGDQPNRVLSKSSGRPVSEAEIREALTISERRRVRGDSTLSIGGKLFQVTERFLGGRTVTTRICLLDQVAEPWVESDGARYALHPVDPALNAQLRRKKSEAHPASTPPPFDPNNTRLKKLVSKIREQKEGEQS